MLSGECHYDRFDFQRRNRHCKKFSQRNFEIVKNDLIAILKLFDQDTKKSSIIGNLSIIEIVKVAIVERT